MALQTQILQFNETIVNTEVNILEYCKLLQKQYYPSVDISFMEKFLEYVTKDEICIPGNLLFDYGILSKDSERNNKSNEIEKLLLRNSYNNLLENIDFNRRQLASVEIYIF